MHAGKPVALFPRCFDALLLLIERRGELLDKDFLLQSLGPGLADALITRLGQLRQTLLRPTSSVAKFAGTTVSTAAAGRELAVDTVIAGSVRRAGDVVRVSVQLVSIGDDAVTWAEKFD